MPSEYFTPYLLYGSAVTLIDGIDSGIPVIPCIYFLCFFWAVLRIIAPNFYWLWSARIKTLATVCSARSLISMSHVPKIYIKIV